MDSIRTLLENNRVWAETLTKSDPGFFESLSNQQRPDYLWIGCSDSRVPANQIIGKLPGEVFVHRNVANIVVHSDLNSLSVIQFAVDVLQVKHIIVCGHYSCGGVRAALMGERLGLVDNWLRHVQDVKERHRAALDAEPDDTSRWARLCELNVIDQVLNVSQSTVLQDAWSRGQNVSVHGWIYALSDGLIQDLGTTVGLGVDPMKTAAAAQCHLKWAGVQK